MKHIFGQARTLILCVALCTTEAHTRPQCLGLEECAVGKSYTVAPSLLQKAQVLKSGMVLSESESTSASYYVSMNGLDDNPGTADRPLRTIAAATARMQAGATCIIREGMYPEQVVVNRKSDLHFRAADGERVVLDGTERVTATWTALESRSGIWKAKLGYDTCQLFADWKEMVPARWPNARFDDDSVFKRSTWAQGTIARNNAYANGQLIDVGHLRKSGINATGAIAVLNVGSFRSYSRTVKSHVGDMITYNAVPQSAWRDKHHAYFLEGTLELLDSEGEWFFDKADKTAYFKPPAGANPNMMHIRAKRRTYAFDISRSNRVTLEGLEFFSAAFRIADCVGCKVESCNLDHPSTSIRMLQVGHTPPAPRIQGKRSRNCTVRGSAFRFTDGAGLDIEGSDHLIDDNLFSHIDWSVADLPQLMQTVRINGWRNVFRRNTMRKLGAAEIVVPGWHSTVEFNDISDAGYLQTDGALVHLMMPHQPGAVVRYNYLHDTPKYGVRCDGTGGGHGTKIHHNVIWRTTGAIMVKGYNHEVYSNTAFDSSKNDIIVIDDLHKGGNVVRNNVAGKISGHRAKPAPIPAQYDHNFNGYEDRTRNLKELLVDTANRDFRPKQVDGSPLIDAGIVIEGITEGVQGKAPDLGALEAAGPIFKAGITWDFNQRFGSEQFAPPGAIVASTTAAETPDTATASPIEATTTAKPTTPVETTTTAGEVAITTTTTAGLCEDKHKKCKGRWKSRCGKAAVAKLCPLTCGKCVASTPSTTMTNAGTTNAVVTPATTSSPTMTVTTKADVATTPATGASCKDQHKKCKGRWKRRCHKPAVAKLCPLTCGKCDASTP